MTFGHNSYSEFALNHHSNKPSAKQHCGLIFLARRGKLAPIKERWVRNLAHQANDTQQTPYLYLTTLGWKSGKQHEIEIWFTTFGDKFYLISEKRERSHWVQNIRHNPNVSFRVDGQTYSGTARLIQAVADADLRQHVCDLSIEKYGWGDGLVVELTVDQGQAR